MENNITCKTPNVPVLSRIAQRLISAFVVVTIIFSLSVTAFAGYFTYSSVQTSNWKYNKTESKPSYNLFRTKKYEDYTQYFTGDSHYQAWQPLTNSYKHYKGESLQTAGTKCTKSHTWSATGTGKSRNFAIELGYVFQKTSEQSVSDTISATLKTGWYYYAQRVITRDFKCKSWTVTYKKNKNGVYVYDSSSSPTTTYTVAIVGQTYCTWIYDPNGRD